MQKILSISIILLVGLSLATWGTRFAIEKNYGSNTVHVGPWSALPFVGGRKVDPYTKANLAVSGKLPLGAAEGLSFTAITDSKGDVLRRNCNYSISGSTPLSRLWTLVIYDLSGNQINSNDQRVSGIFSGALIRFPDSSFLIKLADFPQSGNWIPLSGAGKFKLVLRLYDTSITSNIGVIKPDMPEIKLEGCS